jgi:hypothetical protein
MWQLPLTNQLRSLSISPRLKVPFAPLHRQGLKSKVQEIWGSHLGSSVASLTIWLTRGLIAGCFNLRGSVVSFMAIYWSVCWKVISRFKCSHSPRSYPTRENFFLIFCPFFRPVPIFDSHRRDSRYLEKLNVPRRGFGQKLFLEKAEWKIRIRHLSYQVN